MSANVYIAQTVNAADTILTRYVGDLDESDFFKKAAPGMNTIAWQIGHLISVERMVVEGIKPGSCPPLPEGFDAQHTKETAGIDDPSKFPSKAQYLAIWAAQNAATKAVIEGMTDEQLAAPAPNTFGGMTPTVGHALNFMGAHTLMHVGQFVPVRRMSGKPIVI